MGEKAGDQGREYFYMGPRRDMRGQTVANVILKCFPRPYYGIVTTPPDYEYARGAWRMIRERKRGRE